MVIFIGSKVFKNCLERYSPHILILNTGITLGNLIKMQILNINMLIILHLPEV